MGSESKPADFAFGEAPSPAHFPEPADVDPDKVAPAASHTGTDPHGRAVGPAEDHTLPKLDVDGQTAAQASAKAKSKRGARR